ncbi:MAG: hypothetical protein IPI67_21155 [Myxococcales bacterium]|nr:hypothetical protein [Myxococcales bacterium]
MRSRLVHVAGVLFVLCVSTTPVRALADDSLPRVDANALGPNAESFDDRHRPEASPWVERPYAIEAELGLGAPLGLGGVAFDWSPSPGFSWNLGAGVGESTKSLQLASNVRLRLIVSHGFAAGAEGGLAVGRYEEHSDCPSGRCPPAWRWDHAVWGNIGLMLERRTDSGLSLRWSFGAAGIFNLTAAECVRCDATDEPNLWHTTVPYTLVAVGWAFGA